MPSTRQVQRYGWVPDLPDHRDHLYAVPSSVLTTLPTSADLRPHCPVVYNQGQLGSCTANAIGAAFEFDQIKEKAAHVWTPSRLFIYYNERAVEGTVSQDAGAQIRDGIKVVAADGACDESLWAYSDDTAVAHPKFSEKPPASCYAAAKKSLVTSYQAVSQTASQIKGCLASGYPVVFGFTVYESFESQAVASTGMMPMPARSEQVLGGHAVLCVGYDDKTQHFIVRNSWGTGWGLKGYFMMPYAYLLDANLASDLWTIRFVQTS